VVGCETNIFVEVKSIDTIPIDQRLGRERLEHLELARTGGYDHSSVASFSNRAAEDHRGELGGISTHSGAVGLNHDVDDGTSVSFKYGLKMGKLL
jgi:hypothetical protein